MGDKRLYFDEYENKQYYLDENGNRVYVESDLPAKNPDSSVKVAVIGGVFAIIVAIIGIIPLFPRETLSGETELVPGICLLLNSQIINSILNCGNQNKDIEIAVAATLTANAPTSTSVTEIPITVTPTQNLEEPTAIINRTPSVSQSNCDLNSPITPLTSDEIIPKWRDPDIGKLSVNIPTGYDTLYVNSDPAIFNGVPSRERLVVFSHSDLLIEDLSFNSIDGHFNIWVMAFANCSKDEIFERYGLDGTELAWLIDQYGQVSQYYP